MERAHSLGSGRRTTKAGSLAALGLALLLLAPPGGLDPAPLASADHAIPEVARLTGPRDGAAAVWDGGAAYVFGGVAGGILDDVLKYDPATAAVTDVATLPDGRNHAAAVWTGEHAYIFGGADPNWNNVGSIFRFDPADGSLATMSAALPSVRSTLAAVYDGRYAYVIGGTTGLGTRTDEIVRYDPQTDEVQVMDARLPSPRDKISAVWTGQHVLVFGGQDADGLLDEVVRFDPATGAVQVMDAVLPTVLRHTAAAWDGHAAYVFGGTATGDAQPLQQILRYDPVADQVTVAHATLPGARLSFPGVWDGAGAVLFGGWIGDGRTDQVVRYVPLLPGPPQEPVARPGPSLGDITLSWLAPPHADEDGVTGYDVYRGTSPDELALVASVPSDTFAHTDSGLDFRTRYLYAVRAVAAPGAGPFSDMACAYPLPGHLLAQVGPACPLPRGWVEERVLRTSFPLGAELPEREVLVVDGARSGDGRFYTVQVSAGPFALPPVTVFTAGLVAQPLHVEVETLPVEGATFTAFVLATARHDPRQGVCLVAVATSCFASTPVNPADPMAPGAELVLTIGIADGEGRTVAEQTVRVPFVGQASALV